MKEAVHLRLKNSAQTEFILKNIPITVTRKKQHYTWTTLKNLIVIIKTRKHERKNAKCKGIHMFMYTKILIWYTAQNKHGVYS